MQAGRAAWSDIEEGGSCTAHCRSPVLGCGLLFWGASSFALEPTNNIRFLHVIAMKKTAVGRGIREDALGRLPWYRHDWTCGAETGLR